AVEGLNASARRCEIVSAAQIPELGFDERFLQAQVSVDARGSFANIEVHDAALLRVDVIDVHFGRDANAPIDGTEGCVAVKQVDREGEILAHEVLTESSEEFSAVGPFGTKSARHGKAPAVDEGVARQCHVEEGAIAED